MVAYTYVNIRLPEAKRLADLYGIGIDLRACREYCEKYLQVLANIDEPTQESRHLECFSVYVFIKYGRCFGGGVRVDVENEIKATLSPEDLDFHKFIMGIRNKHIAHSINSFESHKARVWLNPVERGRKVNNVNIESDYLAAPGFGLFENLKRLIEKIFSWIDTEKKVEEKKLTQLVSERYDLDYLYSLEAEVPDDIDYSTVLKTRKGP